MDLKEAKKNINRHPWELSRSENILKECKIIEKQNCTCADIGSGDQFFLELLAKQNPNSIFYAVDIGYKQKRKQKNNIVMINNINLLKDNSIDYLLLMDILEHVENEEEFISILLKKLKENAEIIVTVPAIQNLYCERDKFLQHYRRYNIEQVKKLFENYNNLEIQENFYFYSNLVPIRYIQKKFSKQFKNQMKINEWKYSEKNIVTKFIKSLLNIDFKINRLLYKYNIRIPGLSLFIRVIKK